MRNENVRLAFIKRRAKKLKKQLGIPHHVALERAAEAAGYSNWKNCVNDSHNCALPPPRVSVSNRRSDIPMPAGTLVRLKPRGAVGMVYASNGSTVDFYDQWGPMRAALEEVATCRDQSTASDFRPLRLFLPYGKWTCEDGSEVLFNRDYCPLWKRAPDGTVSPMSPNTWVEHNDKNEEWFFTDGDRPVDSKKSLRRCLAVLREWGVEDRRPKLLDLLPTAIRAGNINLLKGCTYNNGAGA